MARYLVDANLPQTFNLWRPDIFLYANSLGTDISDNYIWDYAKKNSLTIISRDKDFADRMVHSEPLNYKLVLVYRHSIEGIK